MAIKYSLLDIVQKTLSAMDGDEVNSYSDTTESLQVADIAELTYNEIIIAADLPEEYRLYSLNSTGDPTIPLIMTRPSGYETLDWIKYKCSIQGDKSGLLYWTRMIPVPIDEFLKRQDGLSTTATNTATMNYTTSSGLVLQIVYYTNRAPTYYTSFDDSTIIFNSIDKSVETTLQSSHSLCYGQYSTAFVKQDSFIPTFDSDVHLLWLNETIALAQARLRQLTDTKAEKSARRGWIKLQDSIAVSGASKQAVNMDYYQSLPNFARILRK